MVSGRIALHRRQCARHVASRRRRHQSRLAGRSRDREFIGGKVESGTGIGGRLGAGAKAPRMAGKLDSGDADIRSSEGGNGTRVRKRRFTANFTQTVSMVSRLAFASCTLHRHRAATRTHSFASSRITPPPGKARHWLEDPKIFFDALAFQKVAVL